MTKNINNDQPIKEELDFIKIFWFRIKNNSLKITGIIKGTEDCFDYTFNNIIIKEMYIDVDDLYQRLNKIVFIDKTSEVTICYINELHKDFDALERE